MLVVEEVLLLPPPTPNPVARRTRLGALVFAFDMAPPPVSWLVLAKENRCRSVDVGAPLPELGAELPAPRDVRDRVPPTLGTHAPGALPPPAPLPPLSPLLLELLKTVCSWAGMRDGITGEGLAGDELCPPMPAPASPRTRLVVCNGVEEEVGGCVAFDPEPTLAPDSASTVNAPVLPLPLCARAEARDGAADSGAGGDRAPGALVRSAAPRAVVGAVTPWSSSKIAASAALCTPARKPECRPLPPPVLGRLGAVGCCHRDEGDVRLAAAPAMLLCCVGVEMLPPPPASPAVRVVVMLVVRINAPAGTATDPLPMVPDAGSICAGELTCVGRLWPFVVCPLYVGVASVVAGAPGVTESGTGILAARAAGVSDVRDGAAGLPPTGREPLVLLVAGAPGAANERLAVDEEAEGMAAWLARDVAAWPWAGPSESMRALGADAGWLVDGLVGGGDGIRAGPLRGATGWCAPAVPARTGPSAPSMKS